MIGQTISHYRVIELLGEGGMGTVYAAEDTRLGRRVAVKIPHAAPSANNFFHARFLREARSVSALSHPHIATVFDYGETPEGRPFIVMELIQGQELGEVMHGGGLTMTRTLEIVEVVADALAEAHRRGIVHRDVKPSNVIINERGEVKVLDFGLAKLVGDEQDRSATSGADTLMNLQTRSDVMLGTPLYLSPEQAKGVHVDPRSDLFALGALLYECLTGRPAFSGATVVEIAAQIIHVNPPPPSQLNANIPEELDRIVMRALAKRPEERYQKAEELVADLRSLRRRLAEVDDTRLPERAVRSAANSHASTLVTLSDNLVWRPRVSVAAAVAAVLLALGAVWAYSIYTRPSVPPPSPEAEALYRKGVNMMRDGAYWQASRTFQRVVTEMDKSYALAHASLAEALTELDYTEPASQELLLVNTLVPERSALPERDRLYLEAVTATARRDFPGAVRAYEQIARRWPSESHVHVDLGRAYEKADDVERAIESYLRATERNSQDATANLRVGHLYARQQDYESAESAFRRAEEIYLDTGVHEGRAEVLYQRGYMLRNRGKYAEAREQLRQALELAQTTGNETQQINALRQLSFVAIKESDRARATDYARQAVELAQAKGMENMTALSLIALGNSYYARADYAEAEKCYRQALDVTRRTRAPRVEATALAALGSMYVQKGETDEGERLAGQAFAFFQQGGYRQEAAQSLTLLGRVKRQKGNYAEALRAFEEQLKLAEQVKDLPQVALSHGEIASILGQQGEYAKALRHLEASHEIDRAQGDQQRLGYTLLGRVDMLWSLGRYPEARALFAEAEAVILKADAKNAELIGEMHLTAAGMALSERRFADARAEGAQAAANGGTNKKIIVRAKLAQALALANSGGAAAARRLCEEAAEMARGGGDPWLLSHARLALAHALFEGGDARGALEHAAAALDSFGRAGQREAEWRASVVAARAADRAGDSSGAREHAARAGRVLAEIQQAWGEEVFTTYQSRPDVQVCRRQLVELSDAARPA